MMVLQVQLDQWGKHCRALIYMAASLWWVCPISPPHTRSSARRMGAGSHEKFRGRVSQNDVSHTDPEFFLCFFLFSFFAVLVFLMLERVFWAMILLNKGRTSPLSFFLDIRAEIGPWRIRRA
jgi:hypothetical protein